MTFRFLKWRILSGFAALSILCAISTSAHAQTANEIGTAGLDALNAGDYPKAITNFEKFIKDFADSPNLDVVRYSLGLSYLYAGENAKAAQMLEKVVDSKSADLEPLKPEILFFIAQAYLAQASALPDGAEKTALLQKTIAGINNLLAKFPNSDRKTEALMTRAKIYLQAKDFANAQKDLESLRSIDNPDIKTETDYFLGYAYAQQAAALLDDFKKEEAAEMIQKARDTYKVLTQSSNFAIANDAAFQLANLDFADRKFDEARAGFRALRSKKEIVANVQARVDKLRADVQAAPDANTKQFLSRQLQAAQQKLQDVKANPELAVQAMIRIADTYLAEKKYNEARVVLRHVEPFADETQKKVIAINVIITLALQGKADKAQAASTAFESKYPKDPMGETIDFVIGQALSQQGRFDEALQALDRSQKNFPNSRVAAQIPLVKNQIYISQGKVEEAIKSLDKTIEDAEKGVLKISPDAIDQAKRLRAVTLFGMKKTDEAIAAMKALQASTKSEAVRQDATYQIASMLYNSGKLEDAVKALTEYIAKYPAAPNAPTSQFQIILGNAKLSKPDEAVAAAREYIAKYPDNPQAVRAYEQIWGIYKTQKKIDEMLAAQDEMAKAYPDSEYLVPTYFQRGATLQEQKKMDEAKAAYEKALAQYKRLAAASNPGVQNPAIRSNAAFSMIRLAGIDLSAAKALGNPAALDEAAKKTFQEATAKASTGFANTVRTFPEADKAIPIALNSMAEVSKLKIAAGISQKADALIEFSQLAGSVQDPALRLQVNMAQAALAYDLGLVTQSLEFYEKAINDPNAKPTWMDLERYGNALQNAKQYDKAFKVFERISTQSAGDTKAEPVALYGMGAALQEKGDIAGASGYYTKLKEKFPKSPKVVDAEYGNGLAQAADKKYEEAFKTWRGVLANPLASTEAKAKSMLAYGKTLEAAAAAGIEVSDSKQGEGKPPIPALDLAVNNYRRIDNYFEAQQEIAAEALFRAAEILKKQSKPDDASRMIQIIYTKYPTTTWATKARESK